MVRLCYAQSKRLKPENSTNVCASTARRRKALTTSTELISLLPICLASPSTVLSVILTSSAVSSSFAIGSVFRGISVSFPRGGSTLARVASRYFCLSSATSRQEAPDLIVTVAAIAEIGKAREAGR
jgi:hypothetical protein